ncbi:ATP-binding protein [Phycicoccus sp. SLBN-51]|uniref:ATP-binding protein n=1 Tax=Phycicoccus sp. SLBN-51 TaxID=2768447 RepID=UPI001153165A|nr:ATP-binding protein [Phycicoccus sp. SLBN-51]TQJ49302.1 histidine kinase/DNA gyrase B/HSP90-like ATPase [Phycicoccus sp. SLBN-51]
MGDPSGLAWFNPAVTRVRVEVAEEFLSHLVRNPRHGLVELIDNAFDADASHIVVEFDRTELGAVTSVRVRDDGQGMSTEHATSAFRNLGDSWKLGSAFTDSGRRRRGKRGRGRWAAFGIGETVTWVSSYEPVVPLGNAPGADGRGLARVTVTGRRASLGEFDIDGPSPATGRTGTTVRVEGLGKDAQVLALPGERDRLTLNYATALRRQPSLSMVIDGKPLDPGTVTEATHRVPVHVGGLPDGAVVLTVVDWDPRVKTRPTFVLTDAAGEAVHDLDGSMPFASWSYTAYLAWDGFVEHRAVLPLPMGYPDEVAEVVSAGREALSEHIRSRRDAARTRLIEGWKSEDVYPFDRPPAGTIEEAERDLFDLVAIAAAPAVQAGATSARKLSLRLIREALARDPGKMTDILTEVLALDEAQMGDLHQLLQRSNLPSLIAAGQVVAHRLDILNGVDTMVHNPEVAPVVLERRHLHEVVAAEPWLFGDEYTTAVSDRSLTEVLRAHQRELGVERVVVTDSVLVDDRIGRVDLMLSRVTEASANHRQHLIVELKRPSVRLGADEVSQLEQYAFAISQDSRFHGQNVSWDFVLVGSELSPFAVAKAEQFERAAERGMRLRIMSWDSLLRARRHQLDFVQRALALTTSESDGVAELRRMHRDALPEVLAEDAEFAAS